MAKGVGGAGHRVGCHKHCAHYDAAAAQVGQQIGRVKAMAAEQAHKQREGGQHRHGNVKRNAAHQPQVDSADQHARHGAADYIIGKAPKRLHNIHRTSGCQIGKGRSTGNAIHSIPGHDAAEGDQQEAPCRKGGVHEVFPQTAEQALHHKNGKYAAQERDIQRHTGRQAQCQQQTGNRGAAVYYRGGLPGDKAENGFRCHSGKHTHSNDQKRVEAVDPHTHHGGGQQGQKDLQHDLSGGQPVPEVRAGGHMGLCRRPDGGFFGCLIHFAASFRFMAMISALVCLKVCIRGRFAGQIKVQHPQAMQSRP